MRRFYVQEEYDRAARASLVDYLQRNGYDLKKDGRNYYVKLPPIDGVKRHIDVVDNRYIDRISGKGGHSIDFLVKFEGKSHVEAVLALSGEQYGSVAKVDMPRQPLTMPEKNKDYKRVYAYLVFTRCIDGELVSQLFHNKLLYQSEKHGNAVFVCRDEQNAERGAYMRSTSTNPAYRFVRNATGSDKSYPFMIKGDPMLAGSVRVFEGAIDMLSYMTMMKANGEDIACSHFIALGGVEASGLARFLKDNPEIKHIVLCLDNDTTGIKTTGRLASDYEKKGYNVSCELPMYKDWNDDLVTAAKDRANMHTADKPVPLNIHKEDLSI